MAFSLMLVILAAEPSCAPCAKGAVCIDGRCQFTCQRNADCRPGQVCLDVGVCEDELPLTPGQPRMIRRGDATHPSRFRYSGTVPAGYVRKQSPNWWGMVRGLILFSAGYGGAQLTAASAKTWKPEVLIPVAGPAFAYAPVEPLINVARIITLSAEALLQFVGLALIVAGVAVPEYWLERDTTPAISFVPSLGGGSVVGHF